MQTASSFEIFFIGSNPDERYKAVKTLEDIGYLVRSAPFGKDAFEAMQNSGLPNLAIIDVDETNSVSGLMLCNMLRKISDFPILFFAGSTNTETIFEFMNPNSDDFMRKPIDTCEITMRINRMVAQHYKNAQTSKNLQQLNTSLTINYIQRKVTDGSHELILSEKETKLLHILHQNVGTLVNQDTLKKRLWPNQHDQKKATSNLGVAILRLRKKIKQAFDCSDLIKSKYKYGYWLDAST